MSEEPVKPKCTCSLCRARELGVDSWQIMWGLDSLESKLFVDMPGQPIYYYEFAVRAIRAKEAQEKLLQEQQPAEQSCEAGVLNNQPAEEVPNKPTTFTVGQIVFAIVFALFWMFFWISIGYHRR